MRKNKRNIQLFVFIGLLVLTIYPLSAQKSVKTDGLTWAKRMADSEMARFPQGWMLDSSETLRWNYTLGLVCLAIQDVGIETKIPKYLNYVKAFADTFIDASGNIRSYHPDEYNIDKVNSGKILFYLYNTTKDERYRKAMDAMRNQMRTHPKTSEGGFWHKKIYPNQMWLDGLYMGSPFLCQYGKEFNDTSLFNLVALQVELIQKHTFDPKTGLNYHGWDESKQQKWADPVTGCSLNFWGRAEGWYMMALVDILDYLPANHPKRPFIITTLNNLCASLARFQDKQSGVWYQVLDKGNQKGNYLESSASCMFVYGYLKAVRKGYINRSYLSVARKGYEGILKTFIKNNPNGTISITRGCKVAGLGGTPYRSGTFEYYIGEPIRNDDPKATGPFILASLEMAKAK